MKRTSIILALAGILFLLFSPHLDCSSETKTIVKEYNNSEVLQCKKLHELSLYDLIDFFSTFESFNYLDKLIDPLKAKKPDEYRKLIWLSRVLKRQDLCQAIEQFPLTMTLNQTVAIFFSDCLKIRLAQTQKAVPGNADAVVALMQKEDFQFEWIPDKEPREIQVIDLLKLKFQEFFLNSSRIALALVRAQNTAARKELASTLGTSRNNLIACGVLLSQKLDAILSGYCESSVTNINHLCDTYEAQTQALDSTKKGFKAVTTKKAISLPALADEVLGSKQSLCHTLANLSTFINFASAGAVSGTIAVVRLDHDYIYRIFGIFEADQKFKSFIITALRHYKEPVLSGLRLLLHDYVLESMKNKKWEYDKGKRWEIASTCFFEHEGKGKLGEVIGINQHFPPGSPNSREFDIITRIDNTTLWECKNIQWEWLLKQKDESSLQRLSELKKQFLDQKAIAEELGYEFCLISKEDIPEDIEDKELNEILRSIKYICPRLKDAIFQKLYDSKGPYFWNTF